MLKIKHLLLVLLAYIAKPAAAQQIPAPAKPPAAVQRQPIQTQIYGIGGMWQVREAQSGHTVGFRQRYDDAKRMQAMLNNPDIRTV